MISDKIRWMNSARGRRVFPLRPLAALMLLVSQVGLAMAASGLISWDWLSLSLLPLLLAILYLVGKIARSKSQENRRKSLRTLLRAVLRASERAGAYRDANELLSSLPALFEVEEIGKASLWRCGEPDFQAVAGDADITVPHSLMQRALEQDSPLYQRGFFIAPLCREYVFVFAAALQLDEDEQELLKAFGGLMCLMYGRLRENAEARLFGRLMEILASGKTLQEAARRVITLLLPTLRVDAGMILIFREGRFEPLVSVGDVPKAERKLLLDGLPSGWGGTWRSYVTRQPLFVDDYGSFDMRVESVYQEGVRSLAYVPLSGERRARMILVLQDNNVRRWSREEREFLAMVGRGLGLIAEQYIVRERLDALLLLEREVLGSRLEEAYEHLMAQAVRLIPGGEAGSLLVRDGDNFVYKAAIGYDLYELRNVRYSLEDIADSWYGAGAENWRQGEPRLISREVDDLTAISFKTAPRKIIGEAGRVHEIMSNICLPIIYQGEVLAVLNVDSFSDPRAFDEDSLDASRLFVQKAAMLLHEQRYRNLLQRAARTDPLTGLANRRAFEEDLKANCAMAERYGYPLSLLIFDLKGFKKINDDLGHAAGDQALRKIARVVADLVRGGDRIYRWGGDEFAVILSHVDLQGAVAAATRFAAAISEVCLADHCISGNFGAAAFPQEARTPEELLIMADTRMYRAKDKDKVVEPGPLG